MLLLLFFLFNIVVVIVLTPCFQVVKTPVVFIHGNTDSALAAGIYSGFTNNIAYFLDKGYSTVSIQVCYENRLGSGALALRFIIPRLAVSDLRIFEIKKKLSLIAV